MSNHKEIEVRFLEIDKDALVARLRELGAKDGGEDMLEEVICYDKALEWRKPTGKEIVRLRTIGSRSVLAYKCRYSLTVDGVEEIEFEVSDPGKAILFLDRLGYPAYRLQQKRRHTFMLDGVTVDIDTWPRVPTYVELEGEHEESLRNVAEKLGLEWSDAVLESPRTVIEERYGIPVGTMSWFTFDRFE